MKFTDFDVGKVLLEIISGVTITIAHILIHIQRQCGEGQWF